MVRKMANPVVTQFLQNAGTRKPWSKPPGSQPEEALGFSLGSEDQLPTRGDTLEHGHGYQPLHPHPQRRALSICGLPLLRPDSRGVLFITLLKRITDLTYAAFQVPLEIASWQDPTIWSIWTAFDLAAGVVYSMEVYLRINMGTQVAADGRVITIMDGRVAARHHLVREFPLFLMDVATAFPSWIQAFQLAGVVDAPYLLRSLMYLRLLRFVNVIRLIRDVLLVSLAGQLRRRIMGWLPANMLYIIAILYAMMALLNLLGCTWLWLAFVEGTHNSWLARIQDQDLSDAPVLQQYVAALSFAMTTMTTVGYGDITPRTLGERTCAMVIMAVGIMFFGFLVSALGELLRDASTSARRAALLHEKSKEVTAWLSRRHLPEDLREEVVNYYANTWITQAEVREAELLIELPGHLRGRIVLFVLSEVFDGAEMFSQLDRPTKELLAASLKARPLLPGHDLCVPGDPVNCLWILQKGTILALQRLRVVDVLHAPAILGESAVVGEEVPHLQKRAVCFRAQGPCMVWELAMTDLQALMFLQPRLKDDLLEGFRRHIHARMSSEQGSTRDLWKNVVARLHQEPEPGISRDASQAGSDASNSPFGKPSTQVGVSGPPPDTMPTAASPVTGSATSPHRPPPAVPRSIPPVGGSRAGGRGPMPRSVSSVTHSIDLRYYDLAENALQARGAAHHAGPQPPLGSLAEGWADVPMNPSLVEHEGLCARKS